MQMLLFKCSKLINFQNKFTKLSEQFYLTQKNYFFITMQFSLLLKLMHLD